MSDGAAFLAFVREASGLSPDVAAWAGSLIWQGLSRARRRMIRDELLREAARLLPPVSAWAKSHLIAELARRGARRDASTPAGLVALAVGVYPGRARRLSAGQAFRIVSRIPRVEMREAAVVRSSPMDDFLKTEGER